MSEPFREEMRYEYPDLTPESLVLDCGGYEGEFAQRIAKKYGCRVHVLEPVFEHFNTIKENLLKCDPYVYIRVFPHEFGIGDATSYFSFRIKGTMSGQWADDGESQDVVLVDVCSILQMLQRCDLMKLNIEGGEFEVLDKLTRCLGLIRMVKNIQVQWHPVVDNSDGWRDQIMSRLEQTHELTFDYGWTWQNWKLKNS